MLPRAFASLRALAKDNDLIMKTGFPMKVPGLLFAGLMAGVFAAPASAELVLNTALTANGTGLGAVPTVITVLDAGAGNGIESGCISANGAGANFNCLNGLQGGDN